MHSPIAHLQADVLVLGAGLAGLRAAWAARLRAPEARVVLVAPRTRPSGSSFANRNNALGFQKPATPQEREGLLGRIMVLQGEAELSPVLVSLLVDEASDRVDDLMALPMPFRTGTDGAPLRVCGCYDAAATGVVLGHLSQAHATLVHELDRLELEHATGCEAIRLAVDDQRCTGAVLRCTLTGALSTVAAGAVIVACGGPAPLFRDHMAGPGNRGLSWGLLREAGAKMCNTRYMQYMWTSEPDGAFTSPARLLDADTVLFTDEGVQPLPVDLAHDLQALSRSRNTHCPLSHTLADGRLDRFMILARDSEGVVHGRTGGQSWKARLRAHGANGGALVDADSRTTINGLYAAGECAGGMHGADRVGGAMASATQVFGQRAGISAVKNGGATSAATQGQILDACGDLGMRHGALDRDLLARIRTGLSAGAVPGREETLPGFRQELQEMLQRSSARSTRLAALAALCLTEG